jgi:hypothetical protein
MTSRADVIREMEEVRKDLAVFMEAKDRLQRRALELESWPERKEVFTSWSGTQAFYNVSIMCIVRCEGLLTDYQQLLDSTPNTASHLTEIKGGDDED